MAVWLITQKKIKKMKDSRKQIARLFNIGIMWKEMKS